MRLIAVIGVVLIVLGVIAFAVPSFTYFTTDRVAETRFFSVDVSRPHTIVFNPIAGLVAIAAGVLLVVMGRRETAM